MPEVRTAIVGIGNVGSTLVQGLSYYSDKKNKVGLWHESVGGIRPANIRVVAAFDIDPSKVGRNLSAVAAANSKKRFDIIDSKINISPGLLNTDETLGELSPQSSSDKQVGK